jgi:hypothetical protein
VALRSAGGFDWKRALALGGCLAVGVALWRQPVLWPLKVLVVMMHETGHAVATLLVGGHVDRVTIAANQSGQCVSALPPGALRQIVIYSAGYVGSALAGAVLLIATLRYRIRRATLGVMCVWLVAMGLLYAGDAFTLIFCIGTAIALGAAVRWLPLRAVEWINVFVASFTGLYALFDLRDDLWDGAARSHSDAALLSNLTLVPSIVWAVLWTAAAVVILLASAIWALRGNARRPVGSVARAVPANSSL